MPRRLNPVPIVLAKRALAGILWIYPLDGMPRVSIYPPGEISVRYRFGTEREVIWIGRDRHNDIVIDRVAVSSRHAALRRVEDGYELIDAGSTNGLLIDGSRRSVVALEAGMRVMIGDVAIELETDEAEPAAGLRQEAHDAGHARASHRVRPQVVPSAAGADAGLGLLVWLLAAAVFFAGMAVRFQSDTGRSWIEAVRSRF